MNRKDVIRFTAFLSLQLIIGITCLGQEMNIPKEPKLSGLSLNDLKNQVVKQEITFIYQGFERANDSLNSLSLDTLFGHLRYDSIVYFAENVKLVRDIVTIKYSENDQSKPQFSSINLKSLSFCHDGICFTIDDSDIININAPGLREFRISDQVSDYYRGFSSKDKQRTYFTLFVTIDRKDYLITWVAQNGKYLYREVDTFKIEE